MAVTKSHYIGVTLLIGPSPYAHDTAGLGAGVHSKYWGLSHAAFIGLPSDGGAQPMAPEQSLTRARKAVLDRVANGDLTSMQGAGVVGISRWWFYELRRAYKRYGEAGMMPKPRPKGRHPNALSPRVGIRSSPTPSSIPPNGREPSRPGSGWNGLVAGGCPTGRSTTCCTTSGSTGPEPGSRPPNPCRQPRVARSPNEPCVTSGRNRPLRSLTSAQIPW